MTGPAAAWGLRQVPPEQLLEVPDLPRTASGKIQKYRLRDDIRRRAPSD